MGVVSAGDLVTYRGLWVALVVLKRRGESALGATQGHERVWRDFYADTQHPKELWVRALSPQALEQLRAPELPPELADPTRPRR